MNYKRLLALAVFFAVVGGAAMANCQSIGPRIKTAHEDFDFGLVTQNAHVSHIFWLRNVGDQELVIDKLQPNCGCTQAPLDTNRVAPGDSARVELIFSTGRFQGPVEKFTQIMSNATGRAPALVFTADVLPDSASMTPLELTPRAISLDDVRPEQSDNGYQMDVTLKNTGKAPITVRTIDRPDRIVQVEPFEVTLPAGGTHTITVGFTPDLPGAEFYRSVTFATSDDTHRHISLPVYKTIRWNKTVGS